MASRPLVCALNTSHVLKDVIGKSRLGIEVYPISVPYVEGIHLDFAPFFLFPSGYINQCIDTKK